MGRSIYFTDKELKQIRNYALEAIELLEKESTDEKIWIK